MRILARPVHAKGNQRGLAEPLEEEKTSVTLPLVPFPVAMRQQ